MKVKVSAVRRIISKDTEENINVTRTYLKELLKAHQGIKYFTMQDVEDCLHSLRGIILSEGDENLLPYIVAVIDILKRLQKVQKYNSRAIKTLTKQDAALLEMFLERAELLSKISSGIKHIFEVLTRNIKNILIAFFSVQQKDYVLYVAIKFNYYKITNNSLHTKCCWSPFN